MDNQKYPGLPKKVKIGQRTYKIYVRNVEADPILHDSHAYTMGNFDNIIIGDHLSPARARSTLFHELLHAVKSVYNNPSSKLDFKEHEDTESWELMNAWEHFFINLYDEAVVSMLRDNPTLVSFLIAKDAR